MNGEELLKDGVNWALGQMQQNTQMTHAKDDDCDSATDVRFQQIDLDGARGRYECRPGGWFSSTPARCWAANVLMNRPRMEWETNHGPSDASPYSDGTHEDGEYMRNFKKTALHEIGHSLGFFHHPDPYGYDTGPPERGNWFDGSGDAHNEDSMVRGHLENDSNWLRFNDHHRDHINNYLSNL